MSSVYSKSSSRLIFLNYLSFFFFLSSFQKHNDIICSPIQYQEKSLTILSFYSMYKNCNFPQMFVGDTLCLWHTLNSASTQNRQGLCSMSRDSLALSRKHTSSSSFFKVKRDSASSWPNREKVNRRSYSDNKDNFQFTKETVFSYFDHKISLF